MHICGPNVIERVASTVTPRPLIAVVEQRSAEMPAGADFVIVADRVADPGNLGTLMRTAEACGAHAVVVTPDTVDPYSPKVVRASAGSLFRIPVVAATLADVRQRGLATVGTSSHHGDVYTEVDLRAPVALVLGNEAHGLAADAEVDTWVTIPLAGEAESLNVAMAGTVLAFEVVRQRRAR